MGLELGSWGCDSVELCSTPCVPLPTELLPVAGMCREQMATLYWAPALDGHHPMILIPAPTSLTCLLPEAAPHLPTALHPPTHPAMHPTCISSRLVSMEIPPAHSIQRLQ